MLRSRTESRKIQFISSAPDKDTNCKSQFFATDVEDELMDSTWMEGLSKAFSTVELPCGRTLPNRLVKVSTSLSVVDTSAYQSWVA